MWPFCCSIPRAVHLKSTPSPCCLHAFLKATFSPALLQLRFCNWRLCIFFIFLIKPIMTSARLDYSFKKALKMKLLLPSTMSRQCFFPPKVRVKGELMSKKSLSPKIFDWGKAFLLMDHCLALPKVQSLNGMNLRALVVVWEIDLDGWLSSTCRSLIFFLWWSVADCALSSLVCPRTWLWLPNHCKSWFSNQGWYCHP